MVRVNSLPQAVLSLFRLALICALTGCAVVPAYRREALAHPTMREGKSDLAARSMRKFHGAREGASGGEGQIAGGGCGCSN